jgi:tRNA(fMet)-specific endonuclease VapC
MYLLDTDHLTILDRGGQSAQMLLVKMSQVDPNKIATTIISYEEQTRGWLNYITKAKSTDLEAQVFAYSKLQRHLAKFRAATVIDFDLNSAQEFARIRRIYPRLGTMDLKIAAIAITTKSKLLTRNKSDFEKIDGLIFEDWTT